VFRLLDVAQASLQVSRGHTTCPLAHDRPSVCALASPAPQETSARLKLDVLLIRKERAIGIIPNPGKAGSTAGAGYGSGAHIPYEALEEVALAVQVRCLVVCVHSSCHRSLAVMTLRRLP